MRTMTEEEARKTWCPMARYFNSRFGTVQNRWVDDDVQLSPNPACCIASQCQLWEWHEPATCDVDSGKEVHPATGYCGLRARPEVPFP